MFKNHVRMHTHNTKEKCKLTKESWITSMWKSGLVGGPLLVPLAQEKCDIQIVKACLPIS